MHIILGLLGSVVTILWILHSLAEMGISLGGLNPFLWRRRRAWRNRYEANPVYSIADPMEATALLVTAVAKADGEMSATEKKAVLTVFEDEFHLSKREAAGLLIASSHALGKGDEVRDDLPNVLKRSLDNFTPEQSESAIGLLQRIAGVDGSATPLQNQLVTSADGILKRESGQSKGKWGEAAR